MSSLLTRAIKFAASAHGGCENPKSKEPYIFHPLHVMLQCRESEHSAVVAVLHDVVEDTFYTFQDLKSKFPDYVIKPLKLLTHDKKKDSYIQYIEKIADSGDEVAIRVKLKDLEHNMDLTRIPSPTEKDILRNNKYRGARTILSITKGKGARCVPSVEEAK